MPLSDFLIAGSIILGLVSIPILVTGPFSDTIPTGRLVLNMSDVDVDEVPSKMSKIFSSQNFVKTYETAFGRFSVNISAGEINEELSKPGKVTIVNQDTQRTIWKINTLQYQLKITKKPDSVRQVCTTPDGELEKVKQRGEVTESFQGMNQNYVIEVCAQAEKDLQEEVNKIEQIVSESEIPSTENKNNTTTTTIPTGGGVLINEFEQNPEGADAGNEWIELYNPTASNVTIDGWVLVNSDEENRTISSGVISPSGYYVFNATGSFLDNDNEQITLKSDLGVIKDVTSAKSDSSNDNKCWARVPNGQDTNSDTDWKFQVCTKGQWNG